MATSSINKTFVISGSKQASAFANAIDSSKVTEKPTKSLLFINDPEEIDSFFAKKK